MPAGAEMEQASVADLGKASVWKDAVLSRDEQYDLKRKALIQEAARAFTARGYHDTSLVDVARELGVTKGALYYYVKSKQEILFECHKSSIDLGDRAIDYARSIEGSGFDAVVALAHRYMELLVGETGTFAVLTEFDALEPENRKIVAAGRARFGGFFRELIERGQADGSIRSEINAKITEFFYLGAVNWATRWFDPDGELDGSLVAAQFANLLAAAIKA
ncbi:TetR/AcrR family transcriptional regulator [Sphingobium sp. 15-1]|uniref:TetR/AcrR family transcriptional regulator n=1 Tax=Sphingobium sp. 15-1 TaxID=2729616 RepID=UPI001C3FD03E